MYVINITQIATVNLLVAICHSILFRKKDLVGYYKYYYK